VFFPWTRFSKSDYDESIERLWEGIRFDIDNNNLWLHRWHEKPKARHEAHKIARSDFVTWPKLLPVSGHRYLAAEPCLPGNPVFSIMQTDIIYYGAHLADYLLHEFVRDAYQVHSDVRHIDIWSDFVANRDAFLVEGFGAAARESAKQIAARLRAASEKPRAFVEI